MKRGERPPTGSASWQYVRLKAVVSGDLSGTFYSKVAPASSGMDNLAISIDLPDRADRTLNITFTGEYVSQFGDYIRNIEDSTYSIVANVYYNIIYTDAPSKLSDNPVKPSFRHYYTIRTGNVNPVITTQEEIGTIGDLAVVSTAQPNTGILLNTSILADVSNQFYARIYSYSVILLNGIYYKISLKPNFRPVGYEYQLDSSNPYDSWHRVNTIESGYSFWFIDNPNTEFSQLPFWPSV